MTFPNPNAIKRPDYLPPIITREDKEQWDIDVMTRYNMLTQDVTINGKVKTSAYNKAIGGCNQKSIPDSDWVNIVDHCLWVASYTYDRDKITNIQKYNERVTEVNLANPNKKPLKLKKVPKTVCPLPNYFWKLIYFTSCTWYKQNSHLLDSISFDEKFN